MSSELDRRPPLARPARALALALGSLAPALLWRALHPLARERFAAAPAPPPLDRVPVTTDDGWTLELRRLPTRAGAAGEPVLLLPTLGASADLFRCGGGRTLASRLADAGFAVFLGAHRGTSDARAAGPEARPSFDDAAEHDVAAALAAVVAASGYPRVHVVGHGLGAQLALAAAALGRTAPLASLAVLSCPVRFAEPPPALRALAGLVRLAADGRVPGAWRLPARGLARWGAVLVDPSADARGSRRRAGLAQAIEDVPPAVLAQVASWLEAGALCDRGGQRDYGRGLGGVPEPLFLGFGAGDGLCPAVAALPLRDAWRGGPVTEHRWERPLDHLDVVLHPEAGELVHAPLVAWLERQRTRAWREVGEPWGA